MQNIQLARSLLKAALPFADTARRLKRRLVPYQPNMTLGAPRRSPEMRHPHGRNRPNTTE
jgi:hypothetical protein